MGSSFRLVLRSGPTPGKVFPLEKNELFIGRDLSNDVVINDPEISRRHTRLFQQSGTYAVEDMGSTNGTSINGQRIPGPAMLQAGDVLTLGERVTLFFEAVSVADSAPQPNSGLNLDQPAEPVYPLSYPPTYELPQPPQQRPAYPTPVAPTYQPNQQPQPGYPQAGYQPAQPPFAGQVPQVAGVEPVNPRVKAPIWPYWVIGVLLIIILILVVDDFRLWCPIFGMCG